MHFGASVSSCQTSTEQTDSLHAVRTGADVVVEAVAGVEECCVSAEAPCPDGCVEWAVTHETD